MTLNKPPPSFAQINGLLQSDEACLIKCILGRAAFGGKKLPRKFQLTKIKECWVMFRCYETLRKYGLRDLKKIPRYNLKFWKKEK